MAQGQPVSGLMEPGPVVPAAAAQNVGADDEVFIGIEGLAGPDHVGPPAAFARRMRIARKGVRTRMALLLSAFSVP